MPISISLLKKLLKKFTTENIFLLYVNTPSIVCWLEGKKFSGNAKLARHGKMIQHGTHLLNSEMEVLEEALKINPLKFVDKATKSNRSRVTNLVNYLPKDTTTAQLRRWLAEEIMKNNAEATWYEFTE